MPREEFILELVIDQTWIPKFTEEHSQDTRGLGIGVRAVRWTRRDHGRVVDRLKTFLGTEVLRRLKLRSRHG